MHENTYYVAPVKHGNGLICRVGDRQGRIVSAAFMAGVLTAAQLGDVIAVWRFLDTVTRQEAETIATLIPPTKLLICSSANHGMLELSHDLLSKVVIVDVRTPVQEKSA